MKLEGGKRKRRDLADGRPEEAAEESIKPTTSSTHHQTSAMHTDLKKRREPAREIGRDHISETDPKLKGKHLPEKREDLIMQESKKRMGC